MADDAFREGARSMDPADICPHCGLNRIVFASDFKMMGKKKVRACLDCKSVYVNGDKTSDLIVFDPNAS